VAAYINDISNIEQNTNSVGNLVEWNEASSHFGAYYIKMSKKILLESNIHEYKLIDNTIILI